MTDNNRYKIQIILIDHNGDKTYPDFSTVSFEI